MMQDRQLRVIELFKAAIGLEPAERTDFLTAQCTGRPDLQSEVESLLSADEKAHAFLEPPTGRAADESALHGKVINRRIGAYRIVRWIASGGMGSVYEAVQETLGRTVALKVIKSGAMTQSAIRRLEYEAHLLGRLKHPGIAQVYEAGTLADTEGLLGPTGAQVPFFAMEFIPEATPITNFADRHRIDTAGRLALIESVCDAIQHGHQQGVIHRDLKPSNILVVDHQSSGTGNPPTKIIDFGVARATLTDVQLSSLHTSVGQLVGTLAYMSPEQCGPDPSDIDLRSDVYSLGTVLYELLCGRLPYEIQNLSPLEALRIIQQQVPPNPGTVNRELKGDLETIILKAIEKERNRRYQSAAELANDIRHYLNQEPVTARPPSMTYQFRSFARRNKTLVGGIVAAFLLLCAGILGTSLQLSRARRAERTAEGRRITAEREAYVANIAAADAAIESDDGGTAMTRLLQAPAAYRGWEWHHLRYRADRSKYTLEGPRSAARMAASHDGNTIIALYNNATLQCWDVNNRKVRWTVLHSLPGDVDGAIRVLKISPDGRRIGSVYKSDVFVWDSLDGRLICRLAISEKQREALNISFQPGSPRIAVSSTRDISVWDINKCVEVKSVDIGSYVFGLDYSPDGMILANGGQAGATLRDCESLKITKILMSINGAGFLQFSPDGTHMAATDDKCVRVWEVSTGKSLSSLCGHHHRVASLAWSPGGNELITGSIDKTIGVWDVQNGRMISSLHGHAGEVSDLAFVSDGSQFASSSVDGTIRLWDAYPKPDVATLNAGISFVVPPLTWSADGKRVVSSAGGKIILWDTISLQPLLTIPQLTDAIRFRPAALSPDGRFIATCSMDNACMLIDATTGKALWTADQREDISYSAFSPDSHLVASPAANHSILIRDTYTGNAIQSLKGNQDMILSICFSPDGGRVVTTSNDGTLRVWNIGAHDGSEIVWVHDHLPTRLFAAWSGDGSRIATAGSNEIATVWDASSGKQLLTLPGLYDGGWSVAFSPDGSRIATGSKDRLIRIWDAETGRELLTLRGHIGTIMALSWSSDGRRLISGSYDNTLRMWDSTD